jgi:LPXTG-motif cell wall-anchored protein
VSSSTWRGIEGDRSGGRPGAGISLESAAVPDRRLIAATLAALALGLAPGAAFAQSGGAGDDQYVDPLGGNSQQQSSGGSNSSGGSSNGPTLSNTPSLSAQATPAAPAPAASSGQTLPRTGFDAGFVAAMGLTLLLSGAALRRRLRDERL